MRQTGDLSTFKAIGAIEFFFSNTQLPGWNKQGIDLCSGNETRLESSVKVVKHQ